MKIAIAGYGLEGESNYRYWSKYPDSEITVVDQKQPDFQIPVGVESIIGSDAFEKLTNFDLVVRTAGLSPNKIHTNGKIWSSTNEFFSKCPALIIGVTGTKGKGTTASLIEFILREDGKKTWLLGNIGKPSLDVIDEIQQDDIVVYEMSSFQLWDVERSPRIALILFIEKDHQDVHNDMQEYLNAKGNITRFQNSNDLLIYNASNQYAVDISKKSKAKKVAYQSDLSAHVHDDYFYYGSEQICPVSVLKIPGIHNQDNACAAIDAVWEIINDKSAIERGFSKFLGLPHRLQFVREFNGVKYYDDSIATTPSSAIAALRSFDSKKVIILGGSPKGSDFDELGNELTKHDAYVILIGDEAEKISNSCNKNGFRNYEIIQNPNMRTIVDRVKVIADPGSVVLLSPASASFGLFKNYSDRGNQFIEAVMDL